ncbi:unnamed protein product [Symbiodinium sp. CCMP2592]|nr:unnamed protein product [Symbiodinium sp. CCMP2592]
MQGRNFTRTALTCCVATLTLVTFVVGASTGKHLENASCTSDDQALLQAKALVNGGVATCPADPSADTEPPEIILGDVGVGARPAPGECTAVRTYDVIEVRDNCPGDVTWSCVPPSGSSFPIGDTTVTCTATDVAGNTASESLRVWVQDLNPVPPVFDVAQTQDKSGSTFSVGTTTVTCTATDAGGSTASAEFDVNVRDLWAPNITLGDVMRETATSPGLCEGIVVYDVSAIDNCPGDVTLSCVPANGSLVPVGDNRVDCTATDVAGLAQSGTGFWVTVRDHENPVFDPVPDDVTVTNDPGQCGAAVDYVANAADNCPGVQVVFSQESGTTFSVGTTTVTCNATDASGNKASSESFVVPRPFSTSISNVPVAVAV